MLAAGAAAATPEDSSILNKTFTLDDAERLAQLNDAKLLSAEQDKIIAEERVMEARYLFLPEFGLQASATKYDARYPFALSDEFHNILLFPDNNYAPNTGNIYSGRGYMNMTLYEGGRGLNTLRLAEAAQKQATSNYESVKADLRLGVQESFARLLLAQERVKAGKDFLAAIDDVLRSSRLDVWERIEAEAMLGRARAQADSDQHDLDTQRLAFLKTVNIELDTPFSVVGELKTQPVHLDVERAVLWAMELRPELQSETYKAQMDEISVSLAQARRIPTVFMAGDYELTNTDFPIKQNNWDATVGIKLPFSYDYWSQLKEKRAEQRQGQLNRSELQDRVRLEVRQAYSDLQYWQQEFPQRQAQYQKVEKMYEEAGRAPGAALARLRALSGVVDLKLSYLAAVTEHILALARLERAVGREVSE